MLQEKRPNNIFMLSVELCLDDFCMFDFWNKKVIALVTHLIMPNSIRCYGLSHLDHILKPSRMISVHNEKL